MSIFLVFLLSSFNYFMTFLGASLVYLFKKPSRKFMSISLGLASGIMVAASFFSLLLPALESTSYYIIIPVGFICGGIVLRLCDYILPHEHLISHQKEGLSSSLNKTKLMLFAMTLHNIPEGFAVGIAVALNQNNIIPAILFSIGIGIQNFPEGSAISLPMHECGLSKFKAMMYGQLSALVEIPSAILGYLFASCISSIQPFALAFASGAMIFVVIEELIPEANATKYIDLSTMSFMIGFIIMMSLDVIFQ